MPFMIGALRPKAALRAQLSYWPTAKMLAHALHSQQDIYFADFSSVTITLSGYRISPTRNCTVKVPRALM